MERGYNNICEIEVKPASGYSGREPDVNGWMEGWTDEDICHTIIRPTFVRRIKIIVAILNVVTKTIIFLYEIISTQLSGKKNVKLC